MGNGRSATGAGLPPSASGCSLRRCPSFELRSQPEFDAAVTKIYYRPGHAGVPMLIHAHGVAMGEPEKLGYATGIEQVIDVDSSAHRTQITVVCGSVRPPR
jgi:hypothetical protein